jgi:hypothetical protein
MYGIYYYFWHQEIERRRIGNHSKIDEDLEDIKKNLNLDFIVVDLEPSLFKNNKHLPGYDEAYDHVKDRCKDLGLKLLPILSHGSGMLHDEWWSDPHNIVNAFSPQGKPWKFGDGYWMNYSPECLEQLKAHQHHILKNISPEISMGICEVMEDVGYPHGHGTTPNPAQVTSFVEELVKSAHRSGYKGIYHAFRDGRTQPHWFNEIGVDYQDLSRVCDGQIDTVAPLGYTGRQNDYNLFEDGVKLLCENNRERITFITLSADKPQFSLIEQHNRVRFLQSSGLDHTGLVFYSYNEGYNVNSDLSSNLQHRQELLKILKTGEEGGGGG